MFSKVELPVSENNDGDIRCYFRDKLCLRASGRYATTLVRFIMDLGALSPQRQLEDVLALAFHSRHNQTLSQMSPLNLMHFIKTIMSCISLKTSAPCHSTSAADPPHRIWGHIAYNSQYPGSHLWNNWNTPCQGSTQFSHLYPRRRAISWICAHLLLLCIVHRILSRPDKIGGLLAGGSSSLHCFGPQSSAYFSRYVCNEWDLTWYVIHSPTTFLAVNAISRWENSKVTRINFCISRWNFFFLANTWCSRIGSFTTSCATMYLTGAKVRDWHQRLSGDLGAPWKNSDHSSWSG